MFQPDAIPSIHGEIDPSGVMGRFEDHDVEVMNAATGKMEYHTQPYCRMVLPGNGRDEYFQPVRDIDKARFPRAWAAYERQQQYVTEGVPLRMWPMIRSDQINILAISNVFTVEQLAAVPDNLLPNLGLGARELRQSAAKWLETREDSAAVVRMQADLETMRDQNERLEKTVSELTAMLEQLTAADEKPRRGRPPAASAA